MLAARAAVLALRELGYPLEAEAVERLCRSHSALAETATRLWHDNMALRADPSPEESAE